MSTAFRCHFAPEYCDEVTRWRLDRIGDAVADWACDRHLVAVIEDLQRPGERTEVVVKASWKDDWTRRVGGAGDGPHGAG